MSEYAIQCAVADFLRMAMPEEMLWTHVPNQMTVQGTKEARIKANVHRKKMGVLPGVPDFIFWLPGKILMVEMKGAGVLSDSQKEFHLKANRLGHMTVTCRSIEDVQETLMTAGVKLRARV